MRLFGPKINYLNLLTLEERKNAPPIWTKFVVENYPDGRSDVYHPRGQKQNSILQIQKNPFSKKANDS